MCEHNRFSLFLIQLWREEGRARGRKERENRILLTVLCQAPNLNLPEQYTSQVVSFSQHIHFKHTENTF